MRTVLGLGIAVGILVGLAGPVSLPAAPNRERASSAAQAGASQKTLVCPICGRANDQQAAYAQHASAQLARGVVNTAFGWTELLVRPPAETNAGGSLILGIGKGVGHAVKRTTLGIGELLTFWTPKGPGGYLTFSKDCPVCMSASQRATTVQTDKATKQ